MRTRIEALVCDGCGTTFNRDMERHRRAVPHNHQFCSVPCRSKFADTRETRPCGQCDTPVTRVAKEFRNSKSGHLFCTRSCSARYSNAHKTTGTRRSKLEVWLEEQLRTTYPDLDLHCNRRDAINGELDFFFPSLKLAFELNGIFHYEPIFGPEKLAQHQFNDARKFQACLERGIELCVIDTERFTYFKAKGAEKYLSLVRGVVDRVVQVRMAEGVRLGSTDPTRGRRGDPPVEENIPQPHFRASIALEKALSWQQDIESNGLTHQQIADREGIHRPAVTMTLALLRLPQSTQEGLLRMDPTFGFWTVGKAVQESRRQ